MVSLSTEPQHARAEVGVDIAAAERGKMGIAHDVAADDRAAAVPVVGVGEAKGRVEDWPLLSGDRERKMWLPSTIYNCNLD